MSNDRVNGEDAMFGEEFYCEDEVRGETRCTAQCEQCAKEPDRLLHRDEPGGEPV